MSNETDYLESLLFPEDNERNAYCAESVNYVNALTYFQDGDLKNANDSLDKEFDLNPKNPYAWALRAQLLERQDGPIGQFMKYAMGAIDLFEAHEKLCEEYYDIVQLVITRIVFGRMATPPGVYGRLAILAHDLAEKRPTMSNLIAWGWIAEVNGLHGQAILAYETALSIKKEKGSEEISADEIYGEYLIPSLLLADSDKADRLLAEAEAECPDGPSIRFVKAYMLDKKGLYAEAIDTCLETAFRIKPGKEGEKGHALCEEGYKWKHRLYDISNEAYDLVIEKLEKFADEPDASAEVLRLAYEIAGRQNAKDFVRIKKRIKEAGIAVHEDRLNGSDAYRRAGACAKTLESAELALRNLDNVPENERPPFIDVTLRGIIALYNFRLGNWAEGMAGLGKLMEQPCTDSNANMWILSAIFESRFGNADILRQINFTMGLLQDPFSAESHFCLYKRMIILLRMGEVAKAQTDAKQIIEMEEDAETFYYENHGKNNRIYLPDLHPDNARDFYAPLAHVVLGEREKALQAIEIRLSRPGLSGTELLSNCDTAIITYCMLGMPDEAIECARWSIETGARHFYHLEGSPELAPMRERPKFNELMDEYKAKFADEMKELE